MTMMSGPHQRYNPLNDTWVLVCPNRAKRPWQGKVHEQPPKDTQPSSASETVGSKNANPLAPGATRASGKVNPMYTSVYTFPNDFPALLPPPSFQTASQHNIEKVVEEDTTRGAEFIQTSLREDSGTLDDLFVCKEAYGHCEVMCFHPDSTLTIPLMSELNRAMVRKALRTI
ncbi:galactose-1-phosphate uridylyltransferase-like [Convolutriloba macropyga]|uniref:galactose-1-phosphate uridylyltransferase-like n=1 Tax=Convolutriloba macropyga TaxID=536237 RepID=UPI003F523EE4